MKKLGKFLSLATIAVLALFVAPQSVHADTAGSSAALVTPSDFQPKVEDHRVKRLQLFLEKQNSPLAVYAQNFVDQADKNKIDWKLVAAISGVESTYGQAIPAYSYNAWGFGVYGDNVRRFSSWTDGITVVSEALRNDYMDKWHAQNVYEIGSLYAASPTWASRVTSFMNEIDAFEEPDPTMLTLSL